MSSSSGSVDSRGVLRGECTRCGICKGYSTGETSAKRCTECNHPPGVHKKLAEDVSPMEVDRDENSRSIGKVPEANLEAAEYMAPILNLPACQNPECTGKVYYDPRLPEEMRHSFCSPTCRNKVLLIGSREQLVSDIKDLESKLQPLKTPKHFIQSHAKVNSQNKASKTNPKDTSRDSSKSLESSADKQSGGHDSRQAHGSSKQITSKVIIKKNGKEQLGLHFSTKFYQKGDISGGVITGVKIGSAAYKLLQSDSLRLLDIVTKIESRPVDESTIREIEVFTKDLSTVSLELNHSIGLPPMANILAKAKELPFTHVFALRCEEAEEIGVEFVKEVNSVRITATPHNGNGRASGLASDDLIEGCVIINPSRSAKNENHTKEYTEEIIEKLLKAKKQNSTILLFIHRDPALHRD